MTRLHKHFMLLVVGAAFLAGCAKEKAKDPAIGTAFAGPITLNLRQEISPATKVIATAKHGDKLDILQVRRRFVRVRTAGGQEGWTDSRNLLSSRQMDGLQELAKKSAKLPAQGEATVFSTLNMHAEPIRNSTSFYQIPEGVRLDVLAHKVSLKSATVDTVSSLDLNKPPPPPSRKRKKEPSFPPPPPPSAPGLPPNWI